MPIFSASDWDRTSSKSRNEVNTQSSLVVDIGESWVYKQNLRLNV